MLFYQRNESFFFINYKTFDIWQVRMYRSFCHSLNGGPARGCTWRELWVTDRGTADLNCVREYRECVKYFLSARHAAFQYFECPSATVSILSCAFVHKFCWLWLFDVLTPNLMFVCGSNNVVLASPFPAQEKSTFSAFLPTLKSRFSNTCPLSVIGWVLRG